MEKEGVLDQKMEKEDALNLKMENQAKGEQGDTLSLWKYYCG